MRKLVLSIFTLGLFFLLCGCDTGQMSDVQYVEKARDHVDQREWRAAIIELKNALSENTGNAEARRLLGEIYLELGDGASAEKELRRALDLGVVRDGVLPFLARALLAQDKNEELQDLTIANLTSAESKAVVLAAQGLGLLKAGEDVSATTAKIDAAVALAPGSAYVGVANATLLLQKKEHKPARAQIQGVLDANPNYAPAWALLGDLEKEQKQVAEAERAYSKAVEIRPANNTVDLINRATVRLQQEKDDLAQKDLDIVLKRVPKHPGANYLKGFIQLRENRLEEARNAFDLAVSADDKLLTARYFLVMTNLRLGRLEEADVHAEQLLAANPAAVDIRKLVASVKLALGQPVEAEKLVRPIVEQMEEEAGALNLLATALLRQEKAAEAVPLLEKAVTLENESSAAYMRLGEAMLQAGQNQQGVAQVEKSLEIDPQNLQAYLLLVRHYVSQKDLDSALRVGESVVEKWRDQAASWNLLGELHRRRSEEKEAKESFARALALEPGDPVASHGLARLAMVQKDYQQARVLYEKVLVSNKDHLDTLLRLANIAALEKDDEALSKYLKRASAAHPKVMRPQVLLARYYLSKGEPRNVPPLMVELTGNARTHPAVFEVLGMSYLALEQYPEAKYNLGQLLDRAPRVARFHLLQARAHAGLGDQAGMKNELDQTVALEPQHFDGNLRLANLAVSEGRLDAAQDRVALLERLDPGNPDVSKLKANLAQARGDQAAATMLLSEVFEKAPSTENLIALVRAQWAAGDIDAAVQVQEEWVEKHPNDVPALSALANAYMNLGRTEQGVARYQQVLDADKKNLFALNNLAWELKEKDPGKALAYAARAYELAPDSASILDTFAVVLMANGEHEKAQRMISRALQKAPENPSLLFHSAQIAKAAGERGEAVDILKSLLDAEVDFPEKQEARKVLEGLTSR